MGIIACTMALITLTEVAILRRRGYSTEQIQTVAFMSLIAAQWTNAFNARSEFKSSFSRIKRVNHGMIVGFLIAFGLQMLVMFGPLGSVFNIQTVPIRTLVVCAGIMAVSIVLVSELHKFVVSSMKSLRTTR
jgi:magnesium-transporting ATPase (P-type)